MSPNIMLMKESNGLKWPLLWSFSLTLTTFSDWHVISLRDDNESFNESQAF